NVVNLLAINDSQDFETVIRALADSGYVGCWRVLNAQYFGVPQQRRRVFLVAGYRRMPPLEFLGDAAPVDAISPASQSQRWPRPADAWAANTLLANKAGSQITMGCTTFVAEPHGWGQMVERQREAEDDGVCVGLDAANLAEAFGAGNAVVTQVAEWVGRGLILAE
ncbi:hypothetical protein Q9L58_010816, partial [Maublancomyces gigas]